MKKQFVKRVAAKKRVDPAGRAGHLLCSIPSRHEVLLVGGYNADGPLQDIWKMDTASGTWTELPPPPSSKRGVALSPLPRMEFDGCVLGGGAPPDIDSIFGGDAATGAGAALALATYHPRLFLFGGVQILNEQVLILNDLWSLDCTAPDARWTLVAEECPISERSGHVALAISLDHMLVHGGDCMGARDDAWLYTASTNLWQPADTHPTALSLPQPCGRTAHSACYCPDIEAVAIFGGILPGSGEGAYLNDVWLFHCPLGDTAKGPPGPGEWYWSAVQCRGIAPSPRDLPVMHYSHGALLILGGYGLQEAEEEEAEAEAKAEAEAEQVALAALEPLAVDQGAEAEAEARLKDLSFSGEGEKEWEKEGEKEGEGEKGGDRDGDGEGQMAAEAELAQDDDSDEEGEEEEEDDGDEEEDGELLIGYLSDAWLIALPQRQSAAVERRPLEAAAQELDSAALLGPARRGCRTVSLEGGSLLCFGGFDGERFFAQSRSIDERVCFAPPAAEGVPARLDS